MKSTYRFTPKLYGYGVTPSSRQGWATTLLLIAICLGSAYSHGIFQDNMVPTTMQGVGFIVDIVIIVTLFLIIIKDKTNGDIKRRRGNK